MTRDRDYRITLAASDPADPIRDLVLVVRAPSELAARLLASQTIAHTALRAMTLVSVVPVVAAVPPPPVCNLGDAAECPVHGWRCPLWLADVGHVPSCEDYRADGTHTATGSVTRNGALD